MVVALLWLLLVLTGAARGQGIESILAPGKLAQAHAKVEDDCKQCHVRFDRKAQSGLCMACHKEVGADVRGNTGFHGKVKPQGQVCSACHTDHKGRDALIVQFDTKKFDHGLTDFPLRAKHADLECGKCHTAGKKHRDTPTACSTCHRKDDVHKGSLGAKCADCHTENSWKETRFDHATTRFALQGKHADTKCADCHKAGQYKDTPRACVACHRKDDEAKGHKGQFGEKCESCHGAASWKPSTFNHDSDTKYALRGKHRTTTCTSCHVGNLFRSKPGTECLACHAKDDKHKETLGKDCGSCHSERNWKEPAKFDHSRSAFPLLGRHAKAECGDCHKSKLFREAPKECVACHRKEDRHEGSLGSDCKACHSEKAWKDAGRFDHQRSGFPLLGEHAKASCGSCHKSFMFKEAPKSCIACHRKDDRHKASLGEACGDCHGETGWKKLDGRFDHGKTKFPLRNAHSATVLACAACHPGPQNFRNTPLDCHACHQKDDKHGGQAGKECGQCHSDRSWKIDRFDHSRTRFPLIGRHAAATCKSCHAGTRFREAKSDCYACHQKDDRHLLKFGERCDGCHTPRSWALWDFNHTRRTAFVLDGRHAKAACEVCHKQPAPAGKQAAALSAGCVSCHRAQDVHDGQFGTRCESCHGTENWKLVQRRRAPSADRPTGVAP
jgi:hypothetical protein